MKHDLRFHLLSQNIKRTLIDFIFFRRQYPWLNSKTKGRISSNIWSVALWEIFSAKITFYFCSATCSVLSQIWRWQMCFFHDRKAVSSRYHYAAFCCEHRFGITVTNIWVALQHFVSLTTSFRWWCVQNQMVYIPLCGIPSSVTRSGDKNTDQS